LIGTFVRLYHIGYKSLWLDEAIVFGFSKHLFTSNMPPVFLILLNIISRINDSEAGLRIISLFAGVACIPLMFQLAKRFLSLPGAYFSTFLMTTAMYQIRYSQETREYSLMAMLSIAMLILLFAFLDHPSWKNLIILIFVSIIGIFTQFGIAIFLVSINIIFVWVWFLRSDRKNLLIKWVVGQLAILLSIYLLWEVSLKHHWTSGGFGLQYLSSTYWDPMQVSLVNYIYVNTRNIFMFSYSAGNFMIIFLLISFFLGLSWRERWSIVGIFTAVMGTDLLFGLLRLYPYDGTRHVLFVIPSIYLLAAILFEYLIEVDFRRVLVVFFVGIIILLNARDTLVMYRDTSDSNMRAALSNLRSRLNASDQVFVSLLAQPSFDYYTRNAPLPATQVFYSDGEAPNYEPRVRKMMSDAQRVWFVFYADEKQERKQIIQSFNTTDHPIQNIFAESGTYLDFMQTVP
jgi:4-amino-4-deoxy-L-arabinose transferase-like glycosyltransferase